MKIALKNFLPLLLVCSLALSFLFMSTSYVFAVDPALADPAGGGDRFGSIVSFGDQITGFINGTLTPFVFAVALLFFIYGVYLYFIQGGQEDDSRKTGRNYILWAIIALVLMVSVWGITNLIAGGLGFNDPDAINPLIPTSNSTNT